MKAYNIARKPIHYAGTVFPAGSVYGCFNNVYFCVTDFLRIATYEEDGADVWRCVVYDSARDSWRSATSAEFPEVADVLLRHLPKELSGKYCKPFVPCGMAPREKKLDPWQDGVFRVSRGSATTPNRWTNYSVTDKPRFQVHHTNWSR